MNKLLNVSELKAQVSIVDLLARLGFHPLPRHGKEKTYRSMLRDDDNTPSFSVNDALGVWYDHGTGKGGNIIDFGLAFWKTINLQEVVQKINEVCEQAILLPREDRRPRTPVKMPFYKVEELKPIGTHVAITNYLKSRGVFEVAKNFLKEVYYFIQDDKGGGKHYFAAGWKNEHGGWEVRNRYFKGCIGHKGITFIDGHPKNVAVFEGYLDYLSWKTENPSADQSIIVLNSLAMIRTAVGKAKAFSSIDVYFDKDKQGIQHTRELIRSLPYATDRSKAYDGFNDYNDKLKSLLKVETTGNSKPDIFTGVKVPFCR